MGHETRSRWCPDIILDVTHVLTCRSGICLPFVCKALRSALQDLQNARLWGTISPFYYILPPDKYRYSSKIKPERWLALRDWLQTRATSMQALHIKYAAVYKLHANARVCTHCCPASHICNASSRGCSSTCIKEAGDLSCVLLRFWAGTCRRPRIMHHCPPWEEPPWPQAMPKLTELVVDAPGAV